MKEKLVILGAGESGVGAALLAQKEGFDVFVSDGGAINSVFKNELVLN
jgi:UDP-N-acetylmuramoylalanine--D-glutamate ligase